MKNKKKSSSKVLPYELLSPLVELAPDVLFALDRDGTFLSLSPSFEYHTGWSVSEWIGKPFAELIHPDDFPLAMKNFQEGLKNPVGPYELRIRIRDGSYRIAEIRSRPFIKNGKVIGKIGIARDITQQYEMQRRKDEFIGMASHELKTPVTSLKLYLQILEKKLKDETATSATHVYFPKIMVQVDKLTKLISDLLDISRIQTGKLAFIHEPFTIDDVLEDVVESLKQTSREHTIKIKSLSHAVVYGDKERIGQVLINLITNAIKYSPDGGDILVSAEKKDGLVLCSVQDFGIGIDKSHLERIFERFYQVGGQSDRTFPGLGIGLYIASQIIKRHNGILSVKSEKGKGSTFSFSLPVRSE